MPVALGLVIDVTILPIVEPEISLEFEHVFVYSAVLEDSKVEQPSSHSYSVVVNSNPEEVVAVVYMYPTLEPDEFSPSIQVSNIKYCTASTTPPHELPYHVSIFAHFAKIC